MSNELFDSIVAFLIEQGVFEDGGSGVIRKDIGKILFTTEIGCPAEIVFGSDEFREYIDGKEVGIYQTLEDYKTAYLDGVEELTAQGWIDDAANDGPYGRIE